MPSLLTKVGWSAYLARHLLGQARFPFASADAIARAQERRVRAMVAHAYHTVPFYREAVDRLGFRLDSFRTAADLARLPIVERELLQHDPAQLTSTVVDAGELLTLRSGGSSGAPRTVQHSTREIVQNAAHGERERTIIARAVGRRAGYRETVIASPHSSVRAVQEHMSARILHLRAVRVERQYLVMSDSVEKIAAEMATFAPHVVHGYGSYVAALFAYIRAECPGYPLPRIVTFSSDGLSEVARRLIRDDLGVAVIGTYQSVEAFKIGFECGVGEGLHLNVDLYPVRIVGADGREVEPGETGQVIVSNLVNDATVLLNYRLGDEAALLPGACACGRTLPRLTQPLGRVADWLRVGDGARVHSQSVATVFTGERDCLQYQVVQRAARHFTVAVMTRDRVDEAAMSARIVAGLRARLGDAVMVDVSYVKDLPRTARGKVRAIIPLSDPVGDDQARPPERAAGVLA